MSKVGCVLCRNVEWVEERGTFCPSSQVVERVADIFVHWQEEKRRRGTLCLGTLPVLMIQMEQRTFGSKVSKVSENGSFGANEANIPAVPEFCHHVNFSLRQRVLGFFFGVFQAHFGELRAQISGVSGFSKFRGRLNVRFTGAVLCASIGSGGCTCTLA